MSSGTQHSSSDIENKVQEAYQQWKRLDRNPDTLYELEALYEDRHKPTMMQQLIKRLITNRLEFGTAGLRGPMGVGFNHMNDVVVLQTALGIARHLLALKKDTQNEKITQDDGGVVIGYDSRHNRKRFAALSANVIERAGFRTRLFSRFVPTPFVPFAVKKYKCLLGIMVTASHNPKQDNGYKVYSSAGTQIVPPLDTEIQKCILAVAAEHQLKGETAMDSAMWSANVAHIEDPFEEIQSDFFRTLRTVPRDAALNASSPTVRAVYTAMHGVGAPFARQAICDSFGFPSHYLIDVAVQCTPDPEFPTVDFPNPEEGKSSLNISFDVAQSHGCSLILANDPDADRLAVAEKDTVTGTWKVFTGNEIAALMGWWAIQCARDRYGDLSRCCFLASVVSSGILKSMAEREGLHFEHTLTGFKWMGTRAVELDRKGYHVLLAFEESIGFMWGDRVWDKDGITAAGVMMDIANSLKRHGCTDGRPTNLQQLLKTVYHTYGIHASYNSYMISPSPDTTQLIFKHLNLNFTQKFINQSGGQHLCVGDTKVLHIRDLTYNPGYDSSSQDTRPTLPISLVSPMITFSFDNDCVLTLRGSGTEPKIKWYSEKRCQQGEHCPNDIENYLQTFVKRALSQILNMETFGLKMRASHL